MFENLRRAADTIASGLDLTQDMLDKFVDDLMNDIGHLEGNYNIMLVIPQLNTK